MSPRMMHSRLFSLLIALTAGASTVSAFLSGMRSSSVTSVAAQRRSSSAPLSMAGFSEDFGWGQDVVRRQERNARFAEEGARVVEIAKPLGIVLEEDKNGDVYVAEVSPGGNGAKSGVMVGDRVSIWQRTVEHAGRRVITCNQGHQGSCWQQCQTCTAK